MSNSATLYLVSAPSGAGKTSLVRELVAANPQLTVSVSLTTRPKRPTEVDGEDYFFVTEDDFRRKIKAGHFLEHAQVFDYFYGTARGQVQHHLTEGVDVLLEIDWQGARQARRAVSGAVGIFILPPSRIELERRLRGRGTDSDAVIERRLRDAQLDMSHWDEFDYIVVNDCFEHAVHQLQAIIEGRGAGNRREEASFEPLLRDLIGG